MSSLNYDAEQRRKMDRGAPAAAKRKGETEYWFQTADGIRIHYGQEREREQEEHRRKMDRINREENDMIDALSKTKGAKA